MERLRSPVYHIHGLKLDVINRLTQITTCSSCFPFISGFTGLGSPLRLLSNSGHGNAASRLQLSRDLGNNDVNTFSLSFTDSKTPGFSFPRMLTLGTCDTCAHFVTPETVPGSGSVGATTVQTCLEMFGVFICPGNNPSFSANTD